MLPRPRFPQTHRFPFGFVVSIKYRTPKQMRAAGLASCHGAWLVLERTIWIDKTDHPATQALTLAHELQHAAVDFLHWVDQFIAQPLIDESKIQDEGDDE